MATTFKQFLNNDRTTTRTLLHESIPITGSIVSGTYNEGSSTTETNVKNYSHGLFQSIYDYPYLSSSANHIFDLTVGYSSHADSTLSASTSTQNTDKVNIYNQMAQVLVGHDVDGTIRRFDADGNFAAGGNKLDEVFFVNFARLLSKDEIKKGSFEMEFGITGSLGAIAASASFDGQNFRKRMKVKDLSGSTSYLTNSPAGEYGVLYATSSTTDGTTHLGTANTKETPVGLVYYQAGIAVISGSLFNDVVNGGVLSNTLGTVSLGNPGNRLTGPTGFEFVSGSSISGSADAIRNRIYNNSFNNTTELNSTIYFARASHNEFNYSSNPTYLSESQIRVKETTLDQPVSYITTVGLYSATNELLAVAKVSEPLKKTPDTELTLRVRLDY
jgi:hypothetical protein